MKKLFIIVGLFMAVVGGAVYSKYADYSPVAPPTVVRESKEISATIIIDNSLHALNVPKGSTVYDAMNIAKQSNLVTFHAKESAGLGAFIDEINGIKGDNAKGLYWSYYINGKLAQEGISSYRLQPGDTITWKYEKGL